MLKKYRFKSHNENSKEKISKYRKNAIWIFHPITSEQKTVPRETVIDWISKGWKKGRITGLHKSNHTPKAKRSMGRKKKGSKTLHDPKTGVHKMVKREEIDHYLKMGWKRGRTFLKPFKI